MSVLNHECSCGQKITIALDEVEAGRVHEEYQVFKRAHAECYRTQHKNALDFKEALLHALSKAREEGGPDLSSMRPGP